MRFHLPFLVTSLLLATTGTPPPLKLINATYYPLSDEAEKLFSFNIIAFYTGVHYIMIERSQFNENEISYSYQNVYLHDKQPYTINYIDYYHPSRLPVHLTIHVADNQQMRDARVVKLMMEYQEQKRLKIVNQRHVSSTKMIDFDRFGHRIDAAEVIEFSGFKDLISKPFYQKIDLTSMMITISSPAECNRNLQGRLLIEQAEEVFPHYVNKDGNVEFKLRLNKISDGVFNIAIADQLFIDPTTWYTYPRKDKPEFVEVNQLFLPHNTFKYGNKLIYYLEISNIGFNNYQAYHQGRFEFARPLIGSNDSGWWSISVANNEVPELGNNLVEVPTGA